MLESFLLLENTQSSSPEGWILSWESPWMITQWPKSGTRVRTGRGSVDFTLSDPRSAKAKTTVEGWCPSWPNLLNSIAVLITTEIRSWNNRRRRWSLIKETRNASRQGKLFSFNKETNQLLNWLNCNSSMFLNIFKTCKKMHKVCF